MLLTLLKLIISLIFLIWSGSALVSTLTRLSGALRISFFVVSFLLMAGATSIPELFVSISSAFEGSTSLAFGTVVGSNIADIALVLGVLLILNNGVKVEGSIRRYDSYLMALVALLPFILIIDGSLSRIDGVILLIAFVFYLSFLLRGARFFSKIRETKPNINLVRDISIFIVAVIILLVSSHYVVGSSISIARDLNFPVVIVGLILIALGTSLPELVFAFRSSKENKAEMSLGDITGSVVFNATLILGIAAVISPFELTSRFTYLISGIMTLILFAYFVYGVSNEKVFRRPFGYLLIALYIIFALVEII